MSKLRMRYDNPNLCGLCYMPDAATKTMESNPIPQKYRHPHQPYYIRLPDASMNLQRRRRLLLPFLDSIVSGIHGICTSRQKARTYRVGKSTTPIRTPANLGAGRTISGTRQRIRRRQPWITIALSQSDQHADHDGGCFIDHLYDFLRLFDWAADTNQQLKDMSQQYDDSQTEIVRLTATIELLTQGTLAGVELEFLQPMLMKYQARNRYCRDLQDQISLDERQLQKQLDRIKDRTRVVLAQVCESASSFYEETTQGMRPKPDFLSWRFMEDLTMLQACAVQIKSTRSRLNNSKQEGLDLEARNLLSRNLKGLRTNMSLRENRLYGLSTTYVLGEEAHLVYFPTESNLQRLQDRLQADPDRSEIESNDENDSEMDLTRVDNRLPDGRPRLPSERDVADWSDIVNGVRAPRTELQNEERMFQLANSIFTLNRALQNTEQQLTGLRNNYLSSMSTVFLTLPTMSRERFDNGRDIPGRQPFVQHEAQLIQDVEEASHRLMEAQQAMRSYIDSKPVPSESTFREQTNDLNSGNDAVGLCMLDVYQAKPGSIRRWQAAIAREAVPSTNGITLAPSWSRSSVDMDSVRFSEQYSNGNGSDYSAAVTRRNTRWLERNAAIVQQKRQHLETVEGVVFNPDAVIEG